MGSEGPGTFTQWRVTSLARAVIKSKVKSAAVLFFSTRCLNSNQFVKGSYNNPSPMVCRLPPNPELGVFVRGGHSGGCRTGPTIRR